MRSLTPPPPIRPSSLPSHQIYFNYLRDLSMKRHMERICGASASPFIPWSSVVHASSSPPRPRCSSPAFRRSCSVAMEEFHKHCCPQCSVSRARSGTAQAPSCGEHHQEDGDAGVPEVSSSNEERSFDFRSWESLWRPQPGKHKNYAHSAGGHVDPDSTEPMVVAVVSMGNDSFHMVVAEAGRNGDFQIIDSEKDNLQLDNGAIMTLITPEAESRALETMRRFKALASAYGAPLRAVATSAIREAGNRRSFLSNMHEKVGVEVEVLTGKEEACLIYQGVLQALPVYDKSVLVVGVGGGSTEFVIGMAGVPIYATSVKLGYIQINDLLQANGGDLTGKCFLENIRTYVREVLRESGVTDCVRSSGFEIAVGASGTIETIEQIVNHAYVGSCATLLLNEQAHLGLSGFRGKEFTRSELVSVACKFRKAKRNDQRAKAFGVSEQKAEELVGGALLLEEIFGALNIHKMIVSPYALQEGVIVDTLVRASPIHDISPSIRWNSVMKLAKKFYNEDRLRAATHTSQLAGDILACLKANSATTDSSNFSAELVSSLDDIDAELLRASILLHAIGMTVGFRDYHIHSHYLIKNNDILVGYSPLELEIMALLVKYHRKEVPTRKDQDFAQLPLEAQRKTRALCAIIRIAAALNRCHKNVVKVVHLIQDGESCVLVAVPSLDLSTRKLNDISLEIWAAQQKLDFFQKVFKCTISIVVADDDDESALNIDDLSDQTSLR